VPLVEQAELKNPISKPLAKFLTSQSRRFLPSRVCDEKSFRFAKGALLVSPSSFLSIFEVYLVPCSVLPASFVSFDLLASLARLQASRLRFSEAV
jgi:hypothetical protein